MICIKCNLLKMMFNGPDSEVQVLSSMHANYISPTSHLQGDLTEHDTYNQKWRFLNKSGLKQIQDFTKRNKLSMQYLITDIERQNLKR